MAEAELEKFGPILKQAEKALKKIERQDVSEIRTLSKNGGGVIELVICSVAALMG